MSSNGNGLLVVGIDEAGYGPSLGPLVVGSTLWTVPPRLLKSDFWDVLKDTVQRRVKRGGWQLVVDDSKSVYSSGKRLSALERSVLAFATAAEIDCSRLDHFLSGIGVAIGGNNELPWYRNLERPLPTDPIESKFEAISQRLGRCMAEQGAVCRGMRVEVVTEDRFNQRVTQTRNKAAVLIESILRLIQFAVQHAGNRDVVLRVDRLGGRSEYRQLLSTAFPDREMHVLEVCDEHSRYKLSGGGNDWYVEFSVKADKSHLPVALASMVAKYVREVLMMGFNDFWRAEAPELRPTAGYYTDAQRFLGEVADQIGRRGLPTNRFIRLR